MTLTSGVADAVSAVTVDRMMLESSFVRDESNKQKEKEERKKPAKSGVLLSDLGDIRDPWTETRSW